MVGRKFAAVSCCALFFLSAQIERANTPVLHDLPLIPSSLALSPTTTEPTLIIQDMLSLFQSGGEKLSDFFASSFSVPKTFISWSHKLKTVLAIPAIQQNCLTTAIYFEARSESTLGQLAVATVVLNRAQNSNSSICGVVYKGANRFNACQFSFACDGKPDTVDDATAWKKALGITNMAMEGSINDVGESLQLLTIATNYHADYVSPKWSRSLTRLAKIGRHIFYSENPVVVTASNRKNYI